MIKLLLLAVVPFMTQHRNVVPKTEVTTNFYGSVTGIVDNAYIQAHGAGGIDTNTVADIANATIATNSVVAGKLDGPTVAPSTEASASGKAADAQLTGIALTNRYTKSETDAKLDGKANKNGDYTEPFIASELTASGATLSEGNLYLGNGMIFPVYGPQAWGPPMIANTGSGFILYHSYDIPDNPTWHYGQVPSAGNEIAVKGDIPVISATDPGFSNAVLAVGINTNLVASIGELNDFIHDYGELGATSVGGLILALLGAAALLRKKTAKLDNSGNATDAFATDLLGKQVAISAVQNIVNSMFDNGDTTAYPRTTEG